MKVVHWTPTGVDPDDLSDPFFEVPERINEKGGSCTFRWIFMVTQNGVAIYQEVVGNNMRDREDDILVWKTGLRFNEWSTEAFWYGPSYATNKLRASKPSPGVPHHKCRQFAYFLPGAYLPGMFVPAVVFVPQWQMMNRSPPLPPPVQIYPSVWISPVVIIPQWSCPLKTKRTDYLPAVPAPTISPEASANIPKQAVDPMVNTSQPPSPLARTVSKTLKPTPTRLSKPPLDAILAQIDSPQHQHILSQFKQPLNTQGMHAGCIDDDWEELP
jgi:hypothetical protein